MVRPRNALITSFPEGMLSPEEASEALRRAGGDLERAKREIAAKLKKNDCETEKQDATARDSTNALPERLPPRTVTSINNLSDHQYCCVWSVEVFEDSYRPDIARALLARVARHVNPVLRERGWRVKRLIESASRSWIGLCTGNGRDDADAASTNIQLNLRTQPNKFCTTFRSFPQVLSVMLHEITHTSIGLEDIHPPAFYELLDEIRGQYYDKLQAGEVDKETDDYGCKNLTVTAAGEVKTVEEAAKDGISTDLGRLAEEEECGVRQRRRRKRRGYGRKRSAGYQSNVPKRRPLLKGAKMIDGRTKAGKLAKQQLERLTPSELAARAALARFGQNQTDDRADEDEEEEGNCSDESSSDEDEIAPHDVQCGCRSCSWDKLLRKRTTASAAK